MSDHRVAILITTSSVSYLQQVSIQSFLDHGHEVDIFGYGPISNLPRAVTLRHAAKILPRAEFDAVGDATLAGDRFRYLLLSQHQGVISAEADICLLKPLEPVEGYIVGWQSEAFIGGEILALPQNSLALAALVAFTADPHPIPVWADADTRAFLDAQRDAGAPVPARDQLWGLWRSHALTHFLTESGEIGHALPSEAFYPIPFWARGFLLARKRTLAEETTEASRAVALYGSETGRALVELEGGLPKYWSPLGDLLRTHKIFPRTAPIPGTVEFAAGRWQETEAPAEIVLSPEEVEKAERKKAKAERKARKAAERAGADGDVVETDAEAAAPKVRRRKAPPEQTAVSTASAVSADSLPDPKVMIITCMRNEGPFILEWVAYHRSIGIRNFVVYTNDCDDGTDTFLTLLESKGVITAHRPNPFSPDSRAGDYQRAALWDAQTQPFVQDMDWILPMDVDEFLNIHVGEGRFKDLVAALPDANMISFAWRLFGNGFVDRFEDRFVTEQFTLCSREDWRKPALAWGFKTAMQDVGAFRKFGVHRPKGIIEGKESDVRWYNGAGEPMHSKYLESGWRIMGGRKRYGLATLNHYALRSADSYLVKRQRGRVNHIDEDQGVIYWFRMNHNGEEETSIQTRLPAAQEEFSRLMADADIAAQHRSCVAAHAQRIADLKALPDYASLLDAVTEPRMQRMSQMLQHFGHGVFTPGPSFISDAFLEWLDRDDGTDPPESAKIPWDERHEHEGATKFNEE